MTGTDVQSTMEVSNMAPSFMCSYCHHTEFITAKQIKGYAGMIPAK
ncbi:hypothetical protein [Streptococcus ovis]